MRADKPQAVRQRGEPRVPGSGAVGMVGTQGQQGWRGKQDPATEPRPTRLALVSVPCTGQSGCWGGGASEPGARGRAGGRPSPSCGLSLPRLRFCFGSLSHGTPGSDPRAADGGHLPSRGWLSPQAAGSTSQARSGTRGQTEAGVPLRLTEVAESASAEIAAMPSPSLPAAPSAHAGSLAPAFLEKQPGEMGGETPEEAHRLWTHRIEDVRSLEAPAQVSRSPRCGRPVLCRKLVQRKVACQQAEWGTRTGTEVQPPQLRPRCRREGAIRQRAHGGDLRLASAAS
ncbi:uncharacterized protein LOC101718089 [Heterocephalus glaber]|uniref:Uncharacterized protein LOC101718089 n=1 Tax=Heterocephalus glaber TaxID=10181 RepID=A0AAX6T2C9_HETGA|nr:uncharacterized protein LOC101718089 [Heterocephalus glaber]